MMPVIFWNAIDVWIKASGPPKQLFLLHVFNIFTQIREHFTTTLFNFTNVPNYYTLSLLFGFSWWSFLLHHPDRTNFELGGQSYLLSSQSLSQPCIERSHHFRSRWHNLQNTSDSLMIISLLIRSSLNVPSRHLSSGLFMGGFQREKLGGLMARGPEGRQTLVTLSHSETTLVITLKY